MADAMVEEPATTTRLGCVVMPSTRVRQASSSDNLSAVRTSKKPMTQVEFTAVQKAAGLIKEKQSGKDANRNMLKKIGPYLESTYQEVKGLKKVLIKQEKMIKEQSELIREPSNTIQALQTQVKSQSMEECKQLDNTASSPASVTYAAVVDGQRDMREDGQLGACYGSGVTSKRNRSQ